MDNLGYRKMCIGGRMQDAASGARREVLCPATDEVVGEVAWAGEADADQALEVAGEGFRNWSSLSAARRLEIVDELAGALAARENAVRTSLMCETGKTWDETAYEFGILMDALRYFPREMRRFRGEILPDPNEDAEHRIEFGPAGVVVAVLAWNFPVLNLAYKLGPALAAGCSIILKPSSETPLSAHVIGEVCAEVGLPEGVVSILCGPSGDVGSRLCSSTVPAVLTLIGSTETGRRLTELGSSSIKRHSMELGGNAPVLIFPDADLESAAETVCALKFGNAGQICVAPNRVFVHRDVLESFAEAVLSGARAVITGFGRDSGATMGPMINRRERERVHGLVEEAVAGGASLLAGGEVPKGPGAFYPPTVLGRVTPQMRVYREEIFGPVVSLVAFNDEAEALEMANDTDAGLASYLFTGDLERVGRISRALEFGEVQVNGFRYAIDLPHWGVKQSGVGCDCSHHALRDYLVPKRITVVS
jgi:succinate-semialdehyde dehydrogenase/glutarate-semialdehyde dehydrogenase